MSAKNGSRCGKDISQQRAEGAEGGDKFSGTEEAQEPCEGQIIPIEAHPWREQTIGEDDEDCERCRDSKGLLQELVDFFFHIENFTIRNVTV